MAGFIKVNGLIIRKMEMDSKSLATMQNIRENIKMVNHLVMESTFGLTESNMKDNGNKDISMARVYGKEVKETIMMDNGSLGRLMVKAPMSGLLETNIKDNGTTV